MSYGIKVSKVGNDISTATVDKLSIDSSYPVPKVYSSGSDSVTISQGDTPTITIAHNLDYDPFCLVYMEELPGTNKRFLLSQADPTLIPNISLWTMSVDTSNLYITKVGSQASEAGTYDYYYYIFYDPL